MTKPPRNPPKAPLERLPSWKKQLLQEHFTGLSGLFVHQLLSEASAAERSEKGKQGATALHKDRNKVKAQARAYYRHTCNNYISNKDAAGDLYARYGMFKFRTYENWISKWSSE
jgi:hypothetical protein